jgi:UDP-N-acetylmuramoyl-tripeptide--D-alanyl-D-alanine ligase
MDGWSIRDLVTILQGELTLGCMPPLGGELEPVGQIVDDLRRLRRGDLYWELPGRNRARAEEAFARGAIGVIVGNRHVEPWAGCCSIRIDDHSKALWRLAKAGRRGFTGTAIGIASHSGRRTAVCLAQQVLSRALDGETLFVDGNNPDGLARALALSSCVGPAGGGDYLLVELPGDGWQEIRQESDLCQPQIAAIYSVANSRGWNSLETLSVAQQLQQLLDALPRHGLLVLNGDDRELRRAIRGPRDRITWVGRDCESDLIASHVAWSDGHLAFQVGKTRFRIRVWGRQHLPAALGALAIGRRMGLDDRQIAAALGELPGDPGYELISAGEFAVLRPDTNVERNAPWEALKVLRDMDVSGRRVVALGAEVSEDLDDCRRLGISAVAKYGADMLIASGPRASELVRAARSAGMPSHRAVACASTEEMRQIVCNVAGRGDVILLDGCRKDDCKSIVDGLQISRIKNAA